MATVMQKIKDIEDEVRDRCDRTLPPATRRGGGGLDACDW
jgi:hypothetical protein